MDTLSIMQVADTWARKRRERHGFSTNMGTVMAVDGYFIEIKQPSAAELDGQEVSYYQNRKRFWGLITQFGCNLNAKVPGAANDLNCF
jgi:hypothetical protein